MEEDVLNALQTRTAYLPGSFDRDGRIIIIVNIVNDLQLWHRRCLELSIDYLKRSLSPALLQNGVTVIVDAQKSTSRITRSHARIIYTVFGDIRVNLYLVRAEGFWERHVEQCTKSQINGEPVVLSRARLIKYFDLANLPEDLGGTLKFNYDLWLQQRKAIDEFQKCYEQTLSSMETLHILLLCNRSLRPAEADNEVKKCAQMHSNVQRSIDVAIEMGNRTLMRLSEVYAQPTSIVAQLPSSARAASKGTAPAQLPTSLSLSSLSPPPPPPKPYAKTHSVLNAPSKPMLPPRPSSRNTIGIGMMPAGANQPPLNAGNNVKPILPLDLNCERSRIELRLNAIEKKQTEIRTAWLELLTALRETRELQTLEEGVSYVTNWIFNTAEGLLCRQQESIGSDMQTCETLRSAHDSLELECRETYGFYAELLHKIDTFSGAKDNYVYKDLTSQRDFMNFVCRSFATCLERRRNVLITSYRFFRLVNEYFDRTTLVFESLVMSGGNTTTSKSLEVAANNLQKLKESQASLGHIERELIKEGEKLSDMLAMPVKDALGRDLHFDYSSDICNIREILETTIARRNIFGDSVELQKLTLEQMTHIHAYEKDARMALQWMNDLYSVMIRCHSHVGCNIYEIQVQKDELQTFQETGKSIFSYGCQLLEASQALRISCKLSVDSPLSMLEDLKRVWQSLQTVSQEHMTRLRVSAVFHRSVEEYFQQLTDLRNSVRSLSNMMVTEAAAALTRDVYNTRNLGSSSGFSSQDSDAQVSPRNDVHSPDPLALRQITATTASMETATTPIPMSPSLSTPSPSGRNVSTVSTSISVQERQEQLHKFLEIREQLLVEVGRMVRLGRLLKTRLKEPFVLESATGRRSAK